MMPWIQLENRQQELDAEEQAAIEREQWIDDEAARLLSFFPLSLDEFRRIPLHRALTKCCAGAKADEEYQDFILNLAYLQAEENFNLQVLLKWEEPCL